MSDTPKAPADTALVLFSGGQDSATCLAWALERYSRVETVGFDYGQRHATEMAARLKVRMTFPSRRSRRCRWRVTCGSWDRTG